MCSCHSNLAIADSELCTSSEFGPGGAAGDDSADDVDDGLCLDVFVGSCCVCYSVIHASRKLF